MSSELRHQLLKMIERAARSSPSSVEFEMAYQARVAADRIRFAVKAMEIGSNHSDQLRDAGMQLLDALDRLEAAERHFQNRWHDPNHGRMQTSDVATAGAARTGS